MCVYEGERTPNNVCIAKNETSSSRDIQMTGLSYCFFLFGWIVIV